MNSSGGMSGNEEAKMVSLLCSYLPESRNEASSENMIFSRRPYHGQSDGEFLLLEADALCFQGNSSLP